MQFLLPVIFCFVMLALVRLYVQWHHDYNLRHSLFTFELAIFLFFTYELATHLVIFPLTAWLIFAWALVIASLIAQYLYHKPIIGIFANLLIPCLFFYNYFRMNINRSLATNNDWWLGAHHIALDIGMAFLLLALPLTAQFLLKNKITPITQELEEIDRTQYHLVLWALPFLTLGIVLKVLQMADQKLLLHPEQLLWDTGPMRAALVLWFLSAMYLYLRIFLGWRYMRSALLYFVGLFYVFLIQLS